MRRDLDMALLSFSTRFPLPTSPARITPPAPHAATSA
jgi:hypothetical protein